jgi:hypothetical protein
MPTETVAQHQARILKARDDYELRRRNLAEDHRWTKKSASEQIRLKTAIPSTATAEKEKCDKLIQAYNQGKSKLRTATSNVTTSANTAWREAGGEEPNKQAAIDPILVTAWDNAETELKEAIRQLDNFAVAYIKL